MVAYFYAPKKYLNQKQIHIIIERYFQLLWELKKDKSKNIGQELERDSAELDFELKNASVDYLEKELHHEVAKVRKEWEKDIEIYYKSVYKVVRWSLEFHYSYC